MTVKLDCGWDLQTHQAVIQNLEEVRQALSKGDMTRAIVYLVGTQALVGRPLTPEVMVPALYGPSLSELLSAPPSEGED